jgi:hypothetical protein
MFQEANMKQLGQHKTIRTLKHTPFLLANCNQLADQDYDRHSKTINKKTPKYV